MAIFCFNVPLKTWSVCVVLCLGSIFPYFFDLYFPNNAKSVMQEYLHLELFPNETADKLHADMNMVWSFFIAEAGIGGLLGAIWIAYSLNKFGRRKSLLILLILQIPAHILMVTSIIDDAWYLLFIGQIISLGVYDAATSIVPIFMSEISPPEKRGCFGIMFSSFGTLGAMTGGLLGQSEALGREGLWAYGYKVPLALSVWTIPIICLIPDSPTACLSDAEKSTTTKVEKTRAALTFFHGHQENIDVVIKEVKAGKRDPAVSAPQGLQAVWNMLNIPELRVSIALTVAMTGAFVFSGFRQLTAYSTAMLVKSDLDERYAAWSSTGFNVMALIIQLASSRAFDTFGRRPMLLCSCFGVAACWTIFAFADHMQEHVQPWIALACMSGVTLCMNVGIVPIFHFFSTEIFPVQYHTSAKIFSLILVNSMLIFVLFGCWSAVIRFGINSYLYFNAIPLLLCTAYLWLRFPETKGRSVQETMERLSRISKFQGCKVRASSTVENAMPVAFISQSAPTITACDAEVIPPVYVYPQQAASALNGGVHFYQSSTDPAFF